MANMLHGSARTTPRIRAELQASKEKTSTLAQRYGLSRTTVTKWRSRTTTADAPMGPSKPKSTVLSPAEEAVIVEFRRRTLLPLDDVMGCLRQSIPKLSRSGLHRCLLRHMGKMNGADFLRGVIKAFPYKIHTVLTDNGMAFADLPKNRNKPIHAFLGMHIFGRVCNENGITHKLTKPYHPWTNGQAERMNRTIKEATIKAFHYPDLQSLKAHVLAFVCAFNFAKHLKAIRWKTPYQTVVEAWQKNPAIFKTDPRHLIPGPYT